jgi:DNA-directed RNA polymerase subunit RPC12/RpoP
VPSILHYTEPGDIVLDGFGGSGMTGVAAQWCGSAPAAYRHELEMDWKKQGKAAPKWGSRRVILNDLSPAATFIAANYNLPFDVETFAKAGEKLLNDVEKDLGWMYETLHTDGKTKGRIEYTVWSQIYTCPECAGEVNFVDQALDDESKRVKDSFPCPHCGAELTKQKMERLFVTEVDRATGKTLQTPKRKPSLITLPGGEGSVPEDTR